MFPALVSALPKVKNTARAKEKFPASRSLRPYDGVCRSALCSYREAQQKPLRNALRRPFLSAFLKFIPSDHFENFSARTEAMRFYIRLMKLFDLPPRPGGICIFCNLLHLPQLDYHVLPCRDRNHIRNAFQYIRGRRRRLRSPRARLSLSMSLSIQRAALLSYLRKSSIF